MCPGTQPGHTEPALRRLCEQPFRLWASTWPGPDDLSCGSLLLAPPPMGFQAPLWDPTFSGSGSPSSGGSLGMGSRPHWGSQEKIPRNVWGTSNLLLYSPVAAPMG